MHLHAQEVFHLSSPLFCDMGVLINWHIILKLPELNPLQHLSLTYLSFFHWWLFLIFGVLK